MKCKTDEDAVDVRGDCVKEYDPGPGGALEGAGLELGLLLAESIEYLMDKGCADDRSECGF